MSAMSIAKNLAGGCNTSSSGGGGTDTRVYNEIPGGTIDGVNATFTTSQAFVSGSEAVHYNGSRQRLGDDYAISESGGAGTGFDTVTFLVPPRPDDNLVVDYTPA